MAINVLAKYIIRVKLIKRVRVTKLLSENDEKEETFGGTFSWFQRLKRQQWNDEDGVCRDNLISFIVKNQIA